MVPQWNAEQIEISASQLITENEINRIYEEHHRLLIGLITGIPNENVHYQGRYIGHHMSNKFKKKCFFKTRNSFRNNRKVSRGRYEALTFTLILSVTFPTGSKINLKNTIGHFKNCGSKAKYPINIPPSNVAL